MRLVETLKAEKQPAALSSMSPADITRQLSHPLSLIPTSIPRKTRLILRVNEYTDGDFGQTSTPQTAPLTILRDIGTQFPKPVKKRHRPVLVKLIADDLLDHAAIQELAKA